MPIRFTNIVARRSSRRDPNALPRLALLVALNVLIGIPVHAFAADPAAALRERYIGPAGLPSEEAYAQAHGIAPALGSELFDWIPVFKLSYRTADLSRLADAEVLAADCYFVRKHRYVAAHRAQPVWDGRVYAHDGRLVVGAYTPSLGERPAGFIDQDSCHVVAEPPANASIKLPDFDGVHYNPFTGQLWRPARGGQIEGDLAFYLPLPLLDSRGKRTHADFRIVQAPRGKFSLIATIGGREITLATCTLDDAKEAEQIAGYSPELAPGCTMITDEPTTIIELPGAIVADALDVRGSQLVLRGEAPSPTNSTPDAPTVDRPSVQIDGRFDEWRSVPGVADPRGDFVSYLQYNPDADLLEFKVTNDAEYLYFYTRVVGQHGRTAPGKDRYYFYVYMDVDRNASTGYSPTRDDDCYYGVTLGDDCEAQFEFVGGRFVKTFFGFTGRGTEKEVLARKLTIGPSWYSRNDEQGRERDAYKVEYVNRAGAISITEDFTEGTSEDITIALSPDGSECEMRAALSGFLKDPNGKPLIAAGQAIDLAAGVEASGAAAGNTAWGADSTAVLYGYRVAK